MDNGKWEELLSLKYVRKAPILLTNHGKNYSLALSEIIN